MLQPHAMHTGFQPSWVLIRTLDTTETGVKARTTGTGNHVTRDTVHTLSTMLPIDQQTILITGATDGLGHALARELGVRGRRCCCMAEARSAWQRPSTTSGGAAAATACTAIGPTCPRSTPSEVSRGRSSATSRGSTCS